MTQIRDAGSPTSIDAEGAEYFAAHRAGDREAFQKFYSLCYPRVLNYSVALTGDLQSAEDLTQDLFIKFFNLQAEQLNVTSSLTGYLCTSAKHLWISGCRNRAHIPPHLSLDRLTMTGRDDTDELNEEAASEFSTSPLPLRPSLSTKELPPLVDILSHETLHDLRTRVAQLAPVLRETAEWGLVQDESRHLVALRLGIPEGTVKTRLRRSIQHLAHKLSETVFTHDIPTGRAFWADSLLTGRRTGQALPGLLTSRAGIVTRCDTTASLVIPDSAVKVGIWRAVNWLLEAGQSCSIGLMRRCLDLLMGASPSPYAAAFGVAMNGLSSLIASDDAAALADIDIPRRLKYLVSKRALPFRDELFDVVFHVDPRSANFKNLLTSRRVLPELNRVIVPGGLLFIGGRSDGIDQVASREYLKDCGFEEIGHVHRIIWQPGEHSDVYALRKEC